MRVDEIAWKKGASEESPSVFISPRRKRRSRGVWKRWIIPILNSLWDRRNRKGMFKSRRKGKVMLFPCGEAVPGGGRGFRQ